MNLPSILIRPIVTETSRSQNKTSRFSFQVVRPANKDQIKQALEAYFKVDVVKINTTVMPAKTRYQGRRRQAVANQPWKKAIIQLAPGQTLDIFETPETKPAKKKTK